MGFVCSQGRAVTPLLRSGLPTNPRPHQYPTAVPSHSPPRLPLSPPLAHDLLFWAFGKGGIRRPAAAHVRLPPLSVTFQVAHAVVHAVGVLCSCMAVPASVSPDTSDGQASSLYTWPSGTAALNLGRNKRCSVLLGKPRTTAAGWHCSSAGIFQECQLLSSLAAHVTFLLAVGGN